MTAMPAFPREELDEMVQRWLDANRRAEEVRDWRPLADFYTEDATYGWNLGPTEEFMAVGRDEIRELALGQEMQGLEGWQYPYEEILVDDRKGYVLGLWRQIADATRADGGSYEVAGMGGSWFRYAGGFQWSWQRDFFDFGNATGLFLEMMRDGTLSDGMTKRMERSVGGRLPAHYDLGKAPVALWDRT
jgi:hypothetical protein